MEETTRQQFPPKNAAKNRSRRALLPPQCLAIAAAMGFSPLHFCPRTRSRCSSPTRTRTTSPGKATLDARYSLPSSRRFMAWSRSSPLSVSLPPRPRCLSCWLLSRFDKTRNPGSSPPRRRSRSRAVGQGSWPTKGVSFSPYGRRISPSEIGAGARRPLEYLILIKD